MAETPFIAPDAITIDGMTIRSYRPGDGPALQAATVASYEHLRPWMPWATAEQTVEEAEALCRRFAGQYLLNENFVLGVWIGDELAGGTGFHLREGPLEQRNAEIGMWIGSSYAGQGLGTRVLRALLKWGFEEWGWERLTWRCDTRNLASARVAEKNGLKLEGTLRSNELDVEGTRRDTHLFAILRSEWPQLTQPHQAIQR
jgi:RimJ/RimL family protein N-acetyltransferase